MKVVMLSIFEKLKSRKNHQVLNEHLAWLESLSTMDDLGAIEKVTDYLSSLQQKGNTVHQEFVTTHLLDIICRVDEHVHGRAKKVVQQFIQFDNLRPELELRMFNACYYFFRQVFLSYQSRVLEMSGNGQSATDRNAGLGLCLARGINAACEMIRMRYFLHHPAPTNAWLDTHRLHRIAERTELLALPIKIYEQEDSISIDSYYVQAMLMDQVNFNDKSRQQIDLALKLLSYLAPDFKTTKHFEEKLHYLAVNQRVDSGAVRLNSDQLNEEYRFWDMSQLKIKLDLLVYNLNSGKSLENLPLQEIARHPQLTNVANFLQEAWAKQQEQKQKRREARNQTSRTALVCYGFDEVAAQVRLLANKTQVARQKSLDERLAAHSINKSANFPGFNETGERWIITDESTRGLGTEALADNSQHIKAEKIIGVVTHEGQVNFSLGIVRSVRELGMGKRHIGIEIISHHTTWVMVRKMLNQMELNDNPATITEDVLGFPGLYLAKEVDLSQSSTLVVPRINYVEDNIYEISNMSSKVVVKLGKVLSGHDDWVRVAILGKL